MNVLRPRSHRQAKLAVLGAVISIAAAFTISLAIPDAPSWLATAVMVIGLIQLSLGLGWLISNPVQRSR